MPIEQASIDFNASGTPVARHFDDVYFSNQGGLEEAQFVFLNGNKLPERWQMHAREQFVIAETGFGTGLNFLASLQQFAAFRQAYPHAPLKHLYFLSSEKYPLKAQDLIQALSPFVNLAASIQALIAQYPPPVAGCHRLFFPEWHCTLDLWFGDVAESLPAWACGNDGLVDAWYLDGFAPTKNPDMWQPSLYQHMARLSRHHATMATFTAAGHVRRGLNEAGFSMHRQKGFGRKREMLTGTLRHDRVLSSNALPTDVAIVGAGIAAAALADQLCRLGVRTQVYCAANEWADGASGNIQAGVYPQLHVDGSPASQIQASSFLFARRYYALLSQQGFAFDHAFCGVLQLAFNDTQRVRMEKLASAGVWPESLVRQVTQEEACEIAGISLGYPALWLPKGGWVSPKSLIAALIARARQTGNLTYQFAHKLMSWESTDSGVSCHFSNGQHAHHQHLIIATGADAVDLAQLQGLPLRVVRGQVEHIAAQPALSPLRTVLCHKGYVTPSHNGKHALGSTYGKGERDTNVRATDSQANMNMHQSVLGNTAWFGSIVHDGEARASVRLALPDHLPAVGRLAGENVSVLLGLGSRGFTTAPLMANILISELCGQPSPLSTALLARLDVKRWLRVPIGHC